MTKLRSIALLLGAVALGGCFEENAVQDITGTLPGSKIKFFNFGVNAPGVNFYANDTKVTAITSATGTESTTGVVYGGVGSGGFYSGLEPGQYNFTGKIAATVDKDLIVSTVPGTLVDGKSYSMYLSGFYNTTTKTVEGFLVEDPIEGEFDWSVSYVRFVNAISNSQPMTLYAKNTGTTPVGPEVAIGGAVAYKAAGAFVALPQGTYEVNARTAGSSANAITRTGIQLIAGKMYSISARGDITVVSTTATNRPFLDLTANR